jgi:hypothetical protein
VYWRDTVAFTGHGSQQFLGVFEARAAPRQAFERIAPGHQQIERGAVGGDIDAQGADNAQFLENDRVRRKPWSAGAETSGARDNDGSGRPGQRDRLRESRWRLGSYVDDDIRQSAGLPCQGGDGILCGDVDGQVRAESGGKR